jgi:hypothetical protein
MAKFHELSATVDAEQYIFGKMPPLTLAGRTVVPYAREGVLPTALCNICKLPMAQHGWIAPPAPPVDPNIAALPVDPVTGKTVEPVKVAAPPDLPPNSKLYVKPGAPDKVIGNSDQVDIATATADGYAVATPQTPAPPTPAPAPSVYPLTFTKAGQPNRTAANDTDAKEALADGYVLLKPQFPASSVHAGVARAPAPGPAAPVVDKNRGDLEGIVVHPNWWVVIRKGGEALAVQKEEFPSLFTRVF